MQVAQGDEGAAGSESSVFPPSLSPARDAALESSVFAPSPSPARDATLDLPDCATLEPTADSAATSTNTDSTLLDQKPASLEAPKQESPSPDSHIGDIEGEIEDDAEESLDDDSDPMREFNV
jgi:hypothetical protein